MRKILALTLVLMLLFPAVATATEVPNEEEPEGYTISLFGYAIVVVLSDGDSPTVIAIFEAEDGQPIEEELITSFELGGILGSSVSTLAKAVAPGPDHGKVVSAFVKTVNEERKKAKKAEIEERKEEKQAELQERKEEKERLREQKREEREERKQQHQQKMEEKKSEAKGKGKFN